MKTGRKKPLSLQTHSFEECVRLDRDLASLRAEYARKSAKTQRQAAAEEYEAAHDTWTFRTMLAAGGHDPQSFGKPQWPIGVLALAIDPRYAPALLTIGSIEYQLGRKDEAMRYFLSLTELPASETDLASIIDQAGDFLLAEKDVQRAYDLYAAAEKAFPNVARLSIGLGYCLGKMGRMDDAIAKTQRANELEPDNARHLNDLGWTYFLAGQRDQAIQTLKRAAALAPKDYTLPRDNLRYVRAQQAKPKRPPKTTTHPKQAARKNPAAKKTKAPGQADE